jgi:hypothetical protein
MTTKAAHYRLTSDEFLHINSALTNAQLRVYMYWRTLDPFGDRRIEICTKAIAESLGMAQRTVQIALNKLASLNMIIWEKAKSFVRRTGDRLGDLQIVKAITGSSRRSTDRDRQLELSLEAVSESSQSSSSLFNLNQLDQEEIFDFQDNNQNLESIEDNDENSEMSLEEAIALIRSEIPNEPNSDELNSDELNSDEPTDDEPTDDELNAQSDLEPDIEYDFVPEKPKTTVEVECPRRRVEDFVLKTLNKTFPTEARRAAYFSKFDAKSWRKWETDYREATKPQATFKPYIPEKVEVATPDSPVAQSAIAFIKNKLGIKS